MQPDRSKWPPQAGLVYDNFKKPLTSDHFVAFGLPDIGLNYRSIRQMEEKGITKPFLETLFGVIPPERKYGYKYADMVMADGREHTSFIKFVRAMHARVFGPKFINNKEMNWSFVSGIIANCLGYEVRWAYFAVETWNIRRAKAEKAGMPCPDP